jgi:hypothetical protein
MDPLTMTLIAMIPGLIQTGVGAFQGIKGNQLGKTEQPMMEIPDSITDMLQASKNLAGQRKAPGSDIARDRIQSDVASTMSQVANIQGGSGSALAGLGNLFTAEQQAMQNVDAGDQQFYKQNQAQLMEALKTMGAFEDLQWIRNVKEPFDRTMESAAALKQGAIQNMAGGVGSMVGAGLYGMKYNDLVGGGNGKVNGLLPDMQTLLPETINFNEDVPGMFEGPPTFEDWAKMQPQQPQFGVNGPPTFEDWAGQQPPQQWQQWLQNILPKIIGGMSQEKPYSLFQ